MLINGDTLASLQILRSEPHPSQQTKGCGKSAAGSKESLSICGILHALAGTPQGRKRLRQMLLSPVTDLNIITKRQQFIAVLLQPENADGLKTIGTCLRRISDLRKSLDLLQKGVESAAGHGAVDRGAWWTLTRFALNSLQIKETISQLRYTHPVDLLGEVFDRISTGVMKHVGELIGSTIDFEEAKTGSRIAVKWGLNDELDNLKREYIALPELLSQVSSAIAREVPEWAAKYIDGCTFWPQLGFLTTVPMDPISGESLYDGHGLEEGRWQQQFAANDMVYYKNSRMNELDACKGDMYGRILGRHATTTARTHDTDNSQMRKLTSSMLSLSES